MLNRKRKITIGVLIVGIVALNFITFGIGYLIYDNLRTHLLETDKAEKMGELERIREIINHQYQMSEDEIRYLSSLVSLEDSGIDLRSDPEKLLHLRELFYRFAKNKPYYAQLRLIDPQGQEVIRINRKGKKVTVVPETELQDKSQRYYYQDAIKLEPDEVYHSPLDLNVENEKIVVPYEPTIRFATPVRNKSGEKVGIVVLNYNPYSFLSAVVGSNAFALNGKGIYFAVGDSSKLYQPSGLELNKLEQKCPVIKNRVMYMMSAGPADRPIYIGIHSFKEIEPILKSTLYKMIIILGLMFVLSFGSMLGIHFYTQAQYALMLVEQSERFSAIGRIASLIVHDLKGPLFVISGTSELRIMIHQDKEECQGCIKDFHTIKRASQQQSAMMQEILDFSRGKDIKLELEDVSLGEYIQERLQANDKYLKYMDISINLECDGTITIDKLRFNRVIDNLLRNAGEALMGITGKIQIAAQRLNGRIEITIKDNGPGIPSEIQSRMFKIGATAGKTKGTGLGLYSAKMIVELHGGEISYNTKPKEGTTFYIRIPVITESNKEQKV